MKKICIILSLICSAYVCYAQVTDDFSDGDLNNNPTWTSDNAVRHRRGLPVHGQRTHTNARTRKGPKKTVAGKKKATKK